MARKRIRANRDHRAVALKGARTKRKILGAWLTELIELMARVSREYHRSAAADLRSLDTAPNFPGATRGRGPG